MKKFLLSVLVCCLIVNIACAKNTTGNRSESEMVLAKDLRVLIEGEAFSYPLPDNSVIECYAKEYDGSIDAFIEYNDYFLSKKGRLYSQTMHKIYKPNKSNKYKKVDQARMLRDGVTLRLYDSLWEPSIRRHYRLIRINTQTGEYHMDAFQDNAMWYRKAKTKGYCRVINQNSDDN